MECNIHIFFTSGFHVLFFLMLFTKILFNESSKNQLWVSSINSLLFSFSFLSLEMDENLLVAKNSGVFRTRRGSSPHCSWAFSISWTFSVWTPPFSNGNCRQEVGYPPPARFLSTSVYTYAHMHMWWTLTWMTHTIEFSLTCYFQLTTHFREPFTSSIFVQRRLCVRFCFRMVAHVCDQDKDPCPRGADAELSFHIRSCVT